MKKTLLLVSSILVLGYANHALAGAKCSSCWKKTEAVVEKDAQAIGTEAQKLKNSFIQNITLTETQKSNGAFLDLEIDLITNLFFLPVINEKIGAEGSLTIGNGKILLEVSVNDLIATHQVVAALPDGSAFPEEVQAGIPVYLFTIKNELNIYFQMKSLTQGMIAVAFPFNNQTFEKLSPLEKIINFFPPFTFNKTSVNLEGNVVVYSGTAANTTGIGIFSSYHLNP